MGRPPKTDLERTNDSKMRDRAALLHVKSYMRVALNSIDHLAEHIKSIKDPAIRAEALVEVERMRNYISIAVRQPQVPTRIVHNAIVICAVRDIECGGNPAHWCFECPKRAVEPT